MLSLRQLGEFGLIARLEKILPAALSKAWAVAIGDDTAVRRLADGSHELFTTDLLLEDAHFLPGDSRHWEGVGWKALAVNLSDVAAMGGRPVGALVGLGLPPKAKLREVEALYRGLAACSKKYSCPVVGGDTNASRGGWVISVAVLGQMEGRPLLRSAARAGDGLWVTGALGAAALGWAAARSHQAGRMFRPFLRRHAWPEPRLRWGELLAKSGMVGAAIDLSDGLAGDLAHLASASRVGFEVELASLPQAPGFLPACRKLRVSPEELQLCGGEDYELAFTVRKGREEKFLRYCRRHRIAATRIGRAVSGSGIRWLSAEGKVKRAGRGFRHF
ncbi:MAG: thiamine-phosphate kinase [bacterium]